MMSERIDRLAEDGPMSEWTTVTTVEQVTEEVYEIVAEARDGWPEETWGDMWDRTDGALLSDGTRLDWGSSSNSPAMRAIKARYRREMA